MPHKSRGKNPLKHDASKLFIIGIVLFCWGCIDPVEPIFEEREGLIYIDAFLSTDNTFSNVRLFESVVEFGDFRFKFISGADVRYRNMDTGNEVVLTEQVDGYDPPENFTAQVGSTWILTIILPDGRMYRSSPERIRNPVSIANIRATYNPELKFGEGQNRFLPGHRISVDLNDPADEENFYLWKFRSFENLKFCKTCEGSTYFRNGECVDNPYDRRSAGDALLDYECGTPCWQIRFNEEIDLFSDQFTNGSTLTNLPAGDALLYTLENMVVELQQFSLSPLAYEYFRVLDDLVDNNGGLNAPPPVALIGNIFNPNDSEEFVLGRFTAAASSTRSIFIERSEITEEPVGTFRPRISEACDFVCDPIKCQPAYMGPPCMLVTETVCAEEKFKTGIPPESWQELN